MSILTQGQVSSRSVIIIHVVPHNSPQVHFAEYDDMIEAFPAQGPDYSLYVRRLPWTAWCGDNLLDIQRPHMVAKH